MKIGLLGYGKMGRAIEQIALDKGHQIAWRISRSNQQELTPELLRQADVAIEFTRPDAAFEHVMFCLKNGVPVVSGTTGWLDKMPEARDYCVQNKGALLWASNFSVGVNLFFALNRYLARLMEERPEYRASATEIHHIHKLDAPSGTALTLVQDMIAGVGRLEGWALSGQADDPATVPIHAIREGEVPGTHRIRWSGPVDEITIEHRAHSRAGFAAGAVLAAEWLLGKTGMFGMKDVLGIGD